MNRLFVRSYIFILFAAISIIVLSCKKNNTDRLHWYDNVKNLNTKKDQKIYDFKVDTLFVNNPESISGEGFWGKRDSCLYYFDNLLSTVDIYSLDRIFIRRGLGIGRGPGELPDEIGEICDFRDGWLLVDVYNVFYFSKDFKSKKRKYLFNWQENNFQQKKEEIKKNPDPNKDIEIYVPAWNHPQLVPNDDVSVLMKISCEYPDCEESEYYKKSALVAPYNFNKGTLTKLMGAYPPCYQKKNICPAFANHFFASYKDKKFLLTFGLDSLMYICDEKFHPLKSFGAEGKFSNKNYVVINSQGHKDKTYSYEREEKTKGYYTSVYYDKQRDLTFRVYKTGLKSIDKSIDLYYLKNPSRMQIYQGTVLIGDVAVPDKFEIFAHDSYYYADGYIDPDIEKVGFYKFKLELKEE